MPLVEEQVKDKTRTPEGREQRYVAYWLGGSSIGEALFGGIALTLGVIALAGIYPLTLTAIGIISVGLGLAMIGSTVGAKYTRPLAEMHDITVGGLTVELVGGLIGALLGLLGLVGVATFPLFQVAILVLGGSLILGSIATARMNRLIASRDWSAENQTHRRNLLTASAVVQALIGITATVLAILALAGQSPFVMVMVSLLVLGGGLLLTGTTLGGRVLSLFMQPRSGSRLSA